MNKLLIVFSLCALSSSILECFQSLGSNSSGRRSAFQPVAKHAAIAKPAPLSGRETPMAGITFESEEEEEETITFEQRQRQISTSSYASSSEGRKRTDSSSSTASNASSAVSMFGVEKEKTLYEQTLEAAATATAEMIKADEEELDALFTDFTLSKKPTQPFINEVEQPFLHHAAPAVMQGEIPHAHANAKKEERKIAIAARRKQRIDPMERRAEIYRQINKNSDL